MTHPLDPLGADPDVAAVRGLHRYIQQVAAAMGLTGDSHCVDLQSPVSAYLALDGRLPRFPERSVALLWDERDGWAAVTETHAAASLIVRAYLGGDVLPPPQRVAEFVVALTAGRPAARTEPPRLRQAGSRDGLAQRLAAYHHDSSLQLHAVIESTPRPRRAETVPAAEPLEHPETAHPTPRLEHPPDNGKDRGPRRHGGSHTREVEATPHSMEESSDAGNH
jgi:hypothetical protein